MGGLTMDQVLEFDISTDLSEEQLEELYSGIDELDQEVIDEAEKSQLKEVFLRAQYVMKSKQAQLAVAVEEIEKLAEATGENEELKQRNADLQKLVNKFKAKGADARGVDLRAEVEELQAARAQLKKDLKTRQRQLDEEKRENDKLGSRVEELESERRELRRQLDQLNNTLEGMRPDYDSRSDPEDAGEHQYAELLRQKNQYINVLLDDVEAHEREKAAMRGQLSPLRDQLAEATRQIETMTAEFDEYRRQSRPSETERVPGGGGGGGGEAVGLSLQRLQAEVAELRTVKARRDAQFDQLSAIVEQRTDQFKRLITARDAEIEALQAELRRASSKPVQPASPSLVSDQRRLAELERRCEQQRRQLAAQQAELRRATADMETVTAQLETSRRAAGDAADTGGGGGGSLLAVRSELSRSEAQVRQLTERLELTERQAADYNSQVTELTVRIRELMEGEFGLSEAVAEIKEAQRQIGVRDRQVSEQNSYINLVQRHLTELVDENSALRSRLGMEPHEAAELVTGGGGREKLVHVLEREVEKLEEERIALKLENRKLSRQLRSDTQSGLSPNEIRDICRQRKEFWEYVRRLGPAAAPAERRPPPAAELVQRLALLESELAESKQLRAEAERATAENHKLRAGMQEILQSVREQDAVSAVKLAAPSLESLLQALDTRSLVGEYHPALVPYSALQQLEGRNEELRNQLRDARAECRSFSGLSATAATGGTSSATPGAGVRGPADGLALPAHLSASSSQLIGQLTAQLTVALKTVDDSGREGQQTRAELDALRQKFVVLRHQMGLLYEQRAAEADRWQQERGDLHSGREEAETENQALKAQLEQLEAGLLALRSPADQQRAAAAEIHRQMALTVAQLVRTERRLRLAAGERHTLAERLHCAQTELQAAQQAATGTIARLRGDKTTLEFQLSVLQRELERSAPLDKLTEVNHKVDSLTSKYGTLLSNQERLLGEERTSRRLESELELLRQRLAGLETPPDTGHQPATDQTSLQAQLAEMTSREHQQRLRADHAERMAQLLKDQLSEAERRAAELERSSAELAAAGAAGRLALARLSDQLTESAAEPEQTGEQGHDLQAKLLGVEAERDRLKETLQLATSQLEYLRSQQQAAELATDSVRRELAALQDADDLRAVIASLHQRLLDGERSEAELRGRLAGSRTALEAARARLYRTETEAAAARLQVSSLRTAHGRKMRCVRLLVQELRGCLSLPQRELQERLAQTLSDLLTRRQTLRAQLAAAQEARDAAEGERDGVRAQRALLERALQQLGQGAPELRAWLERCQAAELEVTSLRLRCRRLTDECGHVRQQLEQEERRATDAESAICQLKNTLELRAIDRQLETGSGREPEPTTGQQQQQQAPAGGGAGRPSRLPVRRPAGRPTPAPAPTLVADTDAADRQPTEAARSSEDTELTSACERHAVALDALLTSLADQRDVTDLQRRLSDVLRHPAPAAPLLAVSADVIRLACDVTAHVQPPPGPPSPAGTYSIPSPRREPGSTPPESEPPPADDGPQPAERRRLRLAQAAVASLEQRLRQKEQSCAEFRRLLAETRQQAAQQAEQYRQQQARSSDQLRQQVALVASLQAECSARRPLPEGGAGPASPSSAQLSRLHESGELLAEQERAIGALMERLRQSRDQEAHYRDRVVRLESERRETAQLLQRTVSSLTEERAQLRQQLDQQRSQAAAAAEARLQAQAGLVHRLREILLKKERQHHALARVLKDIKAEIVQTVEEAAELEQLKGEEPPAGQQQQQTSGSGRADSAGLQAQLAATQRELDTVKNELNERTLQSHRQQADLHEAERRRRDECQRLQRQLEAARTKLRAAQESQTARSGRPAGDPAKIQEELAKWDERKKWQRAVERLKARLREKETECERQQALAAGLKDTIHRLERERGVYETKIRTLTGLMSEERYLSLERDNQLLKEQLAQLRGSESAERGVQLEQLRQQVHTLTSRLAAQRAAVKQSKNAAANVARFEAQLAQLRVRNQELEDENGQLKNEIAELRRTREDSEAVSGGGGGGGGGESAGSGDTAGRPAVADAGTVSILRRLVERLRADNLRLRRQLLRHTVTSTTEQQVELMRSELNCAVAERDRLAAQLQRLTAMEAGRP